jgi:hypothetical protein
MVSWCSLWYVALLGGLNSILRLLGYRGRHDSAGVSRCQSWLRSASCRHSEPVRSREGADVHLCCPCSLHCGSDFWQSFHGPLPCTTSGIFGQEATSVISVLCYIRYGRIQCVCYGDFAGRLLANAEIVDTDHTRHMHQSQVFRVRRKDSSK